MAITDLVVRMALENPPWDTRKFAARSTIWGIRPAGAERLGGVNRL
jgi:hypothetical protein